MMNTNSNIIPIVVVVVAINTLMILFVVVCSNVQTLFVELIVSEGSVMNCLLMVLLWLFEITLNVSNVGSVIVIGGSDVSA